MSEQGWSWCPQCERWVPAENMSYDEQEIEITAYGDPEPKFIVNNIRVCTACLYDEGLLDEPGFDQEECVLDCYHEKKQCIYCDSWNTSEPDNTSSPGVFKCEDCGETFKEV